MINWTNTNLLYTQRRPILSTAIPLITEGMGLVHAFEGGLPKATPGTGSNNDSFLGIAMGPRRTFSKNTTIEAFTVPTSGPYTVLLKHAVGAAPGIYGPAGAQVASSAGAASTTNVQYATDPTTGLTLLTFDSSFAGQAFTASYGYVMTSVEEYGLFGGPPPGLTAEQAIGEVEIFLLGQIAVNNFDPAANWYAGAGLPMVKVTTGGVFTDAGNAQAGVIPSNIRVKEIPTAANPYLTLECR